MRSSNGHIRSRNDTLIRALKTTHQLSYQLIVDLSNWTSISAYRSQNKGGSEFRAQTLIQGAETHSRFVLGVVDNILLEIAGSKSDKLRLEKLKAMIIMRVDPFHRCLFEGYGLFLRHHEVTLRQDILGSCGIKKIYSAMHPANLVSMYEWLMNR